MLKLNYKDFDTMDKFFIAEKLGMSTFISEEGEVHPVTILKFQKNVIISLKRKELFGYDAVLIGYGIQSKSISKPLQGYYKKVKSSPFQLIKEFKVSSPFDLFNEGSELLFPFSVSDKIDVRSKSIGKGLSGTIKRYNFNRGPMSHGSKNHRLPGSIGAGTTPSNVVKGKKMPGHLGDINVCIKNLQLVFLDLNNSLVFLKGSIPGKNGIVFLTKN